MICQRCGRYEARWIVSSDLGHEYLWLMVCHNCAAEAQKLGVPTKPIETALKKA